MGKKQRDEWELEQSPVWILEGEFIQPSPFFLKWWQDLSTIKYGDNSRWLDIAVELDYVSKEIDPISKAIGYLPKGFDYDPQLLRVSLGIPLSWPIIFQQNNDEGYLRLLNWIRGNQHE